MPSAPTRQLIFRVLCLTSLSLFFLFFPPPFSSTFSVAAFNFSIKEWVEWQRRHFAPQPVKQAPGRPSLSSALLPSFGFPVLRRPCRPAAAQLPPSFLSLPAFLFHRVRGAWLPRRLNRTGSDDRCLRRAQRRPCSEALLQAARFTPEAGAGALLPGCSLAAGAALGKKLASVCPSVFTYSVALWDDFREPRRTRPGSLYRLSKRWLPLLLFFVCYH